MTALPAAFPDSGSRNVKTLAELVDRYFLSELRDWDLVQHPVEQQPELLHSRVLIVGPEVVLQISTDRDGASLTYYCEGPNGVRSFALDLFMIVRRIGGYDPAYDFSEPSPDYEQTIAAQLKGSARRLADHGKDILEGKKDWIAQYGYEPGGPVHESLAEVIRKAAGASLGRCT